MKNILIISIGIVCSLVLGFFISCQTFFMSIEDDALRDEIRYEQKRLDVSHPKLISELTIHKEVENFEGLEKLENLEKLIVNHTNNENLDKINAQLNGNRLREVCIAFGEFDIDSSLTNLVNADNVKIHFAESVNLNVFMENPPQKVSINCPDTANETVIKELKGQTKFFINNMQGAPL